MNQISVFNVYHLPQFFSWFIFLLALTKAVVPFWWTIFLSHDCWWRWGRWRRRSISIHDRPNLQILRNPERKLKALSHTHTQTHTMLPFTKPRGWLKIDSVVCGAEEEVAPASSHMMQKTGNDTDKRFSWVTNASVVNGGLVLRVCPQNMCSHFRYHSESLGLSTPQADLCPCLREHVEKTLSC